ncbi:unnamed protein product, partial [Porites evermanni]
ISTREKDEPPAVGFCEAVRRRVRIVCIGLQLFHRPLHNIYNGYLAKKVKTHSNGRSFWMLKIVTSKAQITHVNRYEDANFGEGEFLLNLLTVLNEHLVLGKFGTLALKLKDIDNEAEKCDMAAYQTQDPFSSNFFEIVKVERQHFPGIPLVTIYYISQTQEFRIFGGCKVKDDWASNRTITIAIHRLGQEGNTFSITRLNNGGTLQSRRDGLVI